MRRLTFACDGAGRSGRTSDAKASTQLVLVFLLLVAVLELLPGVLLRQHRAQIGDVGLRLLGATVPGWRSARPRRSGPAGRRPAPGSAGRGCRRPAAPTPSAYRSRRFADRLRARRTCRDWKAPRARSASGRAPCGRACAPAWRRPSGRGSRLRPRPASSPDIRASGRGESRRAPARTGRRRPATCRRRRAPRGPWDRRSPACA